jgi:AraC-like DNA-binding protein
MTSARLSPKLALTAPHGFALSSNRQPRYARDWHTHDCAMLLWPHTGGLKAAWADPTLERAALTSARLVRSTALLLPASVVHNTRAITVDQRHGELYLAKEHLGEGVRFGARRLDASLVHMLDALMSPTLDPVAATPLVEALVAQLRRGPDAALSSEAPVELGHRMAQAFRLALEWDRPVPLVDRVAQELGVSVRQLQRASQQVFGASPVAVRRQMLAARARELMARGDSLAQISQRLGFASSGHLGRLLRSLPA